MRHQVDFLLFWVILENTFGQFAGFFTFDLLILILGVHCYIVLVPYIVDEPYLPA